MNRPVQTFRDGPILCSVWLRQSTAGVFYDVTVCRTYRDDSNGKERYAYTFSDRHLATLSRLVCQAAVWIADKKRNATTVVIDAR